jgi:hypothetical protein
MKIKILYTIVILLSLFLSTCGIVEDEQDVKLNLELELEKYALLETDTLKVTFTITNISSNTLTYNFGSSCEVGFIFRSNNVIVNQYPKGCAAVMTSFKLKSNELRKYQFKFLLVDENYNILKKGNYVIEAFLLAEDSPVVSKSFIII